MAVRANKTFGYMYEKNMVKGYIALRNDVEKQNGMLHTTHLV